ncbi:MAG TPA: inositol 2-dehydrogenase [Phnomibacter sp.]|nr:inositol 2-dehydrogenase [Phnomibacter sp.]
MKTIGIGLLGLGRIGKIHFKNIMHYFDQARIVAVADPLYDMNALGNGFGNIYFSKEEEDVIAHPDVDAVLICSSTSAHAHSLQLALKHKKHIFCEKPMDLSLATTTELAALAADTPVKLMIGFNRRFDPDFMKARETVASGKVGNVQIVKITSRDPGLPPRDYIKHSGGLFMDMAIHDFDMARYMMNKEVVEVYAKGLVMVDQAVAEAGDIDTALTTLTFDDGTYAVIDNSRKAVYGYDQRIEVFGSGGMLQVENNQHNRNILFNETGIHQSLPLDFFMDRYAESYLGEMKIFIDSVVNDKPVPVTADDALMASRIAEAAKLSVQGQRPVCIDEIKLITQQTKAGVPDVEVIA